MTAQHKAPGGGENRSGAQDNTTTNRVRRPRKTAHNGRRPKRRIRSGLAAYEARKASWIAHHPTATHAQYQEAMRRLAAACGV